MSLSACEWKAAQEQAESLTRKPPATPTATPKPTATPTATPQSPATPTPTPSTTGWGAVPCGPTSNIVAYVNDTWSNNSDCQPYSIQLSPSKRVVRFEIRQGDNRWNGEDNDSPVNRDELRLESFRPKPGTEIWMSYSMMIEPGELTDSRWTILGQMHAGSGSPPLNFDLAPGSSTIRIMTLTDGQSGMLQRASFPIVRGQWSHIVFRARFLGQGYAGPALLEVWVNGKAVFSDTNIAMGMSFSDHNYWKLGVYRRESATTLKVQYANSEYKTGPDALRSRIAAPALISY